MMTRMKTESYVELPRRFINWGLRVDPEQNPVQKSLQQSTKLCNNRNYYNQQNSAITKIITINKTLQQQKSLKSAKLYNNRNHWNQQYYTITEIIQVSNTIQLAILCDNNNNNYTKCYLRTSGNNNDYKWQNSAIKNKTVNIVNCLVVWQKTILSPFFFNGPFPYLIHLMHDITKVYCEKDYIIVLQWSLWRVLVNVLRTAV